MKSSSTQSKSIGIIGGGIAGSTIALQLSQHDINVVLFEEGKSLVNGPPVCHLHAGGNLYPEISQEQCIILLKQSIDTIKVYPQCINKRPTIIANPKRDPGNINALLPRLIKLQQAYQSLIQQDPSNEVLGKPEDYYQLCSRSDLEKLIGKKQDTEINTLAQWLIPFANEVDLDTIKFPILIVQEYGLSLFRIAATSLLSLTASPTCTLLTNNKVQDVKRLSDNTWEISHTENGRLVTTNVDYLVNACGYRTGVIDDMTEQKKTRMVEFKAAYVTQWQQAYTWPEVVFHGSRGTPNGMAQLTPYPDGYFQLHGMTEEITLFKDGLAKTTQQSAQPQLATHLQDKLTHGWSPEESATRTQKAIKHLAYFIPSFTDAQHCSTPLFGAQQVPGEDISLRAYDVSFEKGNYARAEIVKASSALSVAEQIINKLLSNNFMPALDKTSTSQKFNANVDKTKIDTLSQQIASDRNYPISLAKV